MASRAHLASCLAVSIKQAARVALKYKMMNFYKADLQPKEWRTNCEDFGVFDEQLLQDFIDRADNGTPSEYRERVDRLKTAIHRLNLQIAQAQRRSNPRKRT